MPLEPFANWGELDDPHHTDAVDARKPSINLAPRQPLPPPVPTAWEWRISDAAGPVSVRRDDPSPAGSLPSRTWGLQGAPTPSRYAIEPSRLHVFTEEVGRLDLRPLLGPYGRALSMTVTGAGKEDVHVLASGPLRLFSFYGAGASDDGGSQGVARKVELMGEPWGNFLDDEPFLAPFSVGVEGERVGVVFPRKGYMVRPSVRPPKQARSLARSLACPLVLLPVLVAAVGQTTRTQRRNNR